MKKIITIFLAILLSLTFCACSTNKALTKEEMLSVAIEAHASDIELDSSKNIAGAKQKYCNKTLLLSGMVRKIKEDYIEVSALGSPDYIIDVYLPLEELVNLEESQYITVVGTTTDEITESSENVIEYTYNYKHYQMPVAYFVKDTVEIKGVLKGPNRSNSPAFNIQVGSNTEYNLIYFTDNVDTSKLKIGQEITFVARANMKLVWHYYDAEIIE